MPYAASGDGTRIQYALQGSGVAFVFHPGATGSRRDWHLLGYVDALKGDYRLLLVDPRGQGLTACAAATLPRSAAHPRRR